jgi:hypothetical protein
MKIKLPNTGLKQYGLAVSSAWGSCLVLTAIFYFLAVGPQEITLARLRKDFLVSNEQYAQAQMAHRPETRVNLETKLKSVAKQTGRFVVQPEEATKLTLQLSQLAIQHKLADFSSKTRDISSTFGPDDKPKVSEVWIELTFKAPFNQVNAFINSLERNEPSLFIESAQMIRDPQTTEDPTSNLLISYLVGNRQAMKIPDEANSLLVP